MRKINQFEDYLLQPAQPNTTKHNKHNKAQKHNIKLQSPEYYNKVIDELRQQLEHRRTVKPTSPEELSVVIDELRQQLKEIREQLLK